VTTTQAPREGAGAPIGRLAARLAGATRTRPADADEAGRALERWRVPPLPAGLSASTEAEIQAMARRVSTIAAVYVAEGPDGATPLAVAPGPDRVAILP
jgi:hypothetical protein